MSVIRDRIPATYVRYIEPFFGSGCVFFDTLPDEARLSDTNEDLVGFFLALRDDVEHLIQAYDNYDHTGADYYDVRAVDPKTLEPTERAARFLHLNRNAFNSVYRTNRQGFFNVPRGNKVGPRPTNDDLHASSAALAGQRLEVSDYLAATRVATAGDFVYLDPPYRSATRQTYGEYGYGTFGGSSDVRALGLEVQRLTAAGVQVMLSFNADDELLPFLSGWETQVIERKRTVAASPAARTPLRGEILSTNYELCDA